MFRTPPLDPPRAPEVPSITNLPNERKKTSNERNAESGFESDFEFQAMMGLDIYGVLKLRHSLHSGFWGERSCEKSRGARSHGELSTSRQSVGKEEPDELQIP